MKEIQIVPVMDCIVLKGSDYLSLSNKIDDFKRKMEMMNHLTSWLRNNHESVFDEYKALRIKMHDEHVEESIQREVG